MAHKKTDTIIDHFLPDFCDIKVVFGVVLLAQFLAFLLQLASGPADSSFWSQLGLKSMFILWIALLTAATLCILRRSLRSLSNSWSGLIAFSIIQCITILISWLSKNLLPAYGLLPYPSGNETETVFYLRTMGTSCLIALVFLHYLQLTHQKNLQIKAESEARLTAMQARIRPHFLFNSLNTIASLTRVNPVLAEELVEDLAELFRVTLKADRKLVALRDELHLVKQYLNIESNRLAKRLRVEWDVADVPLNAQVPPLILQPLVENAVHHGVEPSVNGGIVYINADYIKDKIVLAVKNDIPPEQAAKTRQGNKMAVENISARLQSCFPDEGKIFISSYDGIYQVRVVFPYTKMDPA